MSIGDVFFGSAAAFLTGILAASLDWNIIWLTGIILIIGLSLLWIEGWMRFWKFILLFVGLIFIGAFYGRAYLNWKIQHEVLPGKSDVFTAVIVDEPKSAGKFLIFSVALQFPFLGTVTVFASSSDDFRYGGLIETKGTVSPGKNLGEDPIIFPKTIVIFDEHQGFWLREKMLDLKAGIMWEFRQFLAPDAAALLGGITFGGTNSMSKNLRDQMTLSGTSYVTSMYGFKLYVVAWAIEESLKYYLARRKRFLIAAAFILLFVAMAGASVIVVRAAIIIFLVLLSKEIGRALSKRNALAMIAAAMAIFDPAIVIQLGFTLSFLSIAGILYLEEPLKRFLKWEKKGDGMLKWRMSVIMALAVLLAIIPVIVADSGKEFSLAIFLSNALIGISMVPATTFGYTLAFAGFISPYLGIIVAKLGGVILWCEFAIIKIFAAFTLPLPIKFDSVTSFAVYYSGLGWFVWKYRNTE